MKIKVFLLLLGILVFLFKPGFSLANGVLPDYSDLSWLEGNFEFSDGTIGTVVSRILPIVFIAAGIVLLIFLLLGGFKLLTSAGDPKAIQAGQKILTNAIIGFIIVIASYWITQIIEIIFNIEIMG